MSRIEHAAFQSNRLVVITHKPGFRSDDCTYSASSHSDSSSDTSGASNSRPCSTMMLHDSSMHVHGSVVDVRGLTTFASPPLSGWLNCCMPYELSRQPLRNPLFAACPKGTPPVPKTNYVSMQQQICNAAACKSLSAVRRTVILVCIAVGPYAYIIVLSSYWKSKLLHRDTS